VEDRALNSHIFGDIIHTQCFLFFDLVFPFISDYEDPTTTAIGSQHYKWTRIRIDLVSGPWSTLQEELENEKTFRLLASEWQSGRLGVLPEWQTQAQTAHESSLPSGQTSPPSCKVLNEWSRLVKSLDPPSTSMVAKRLIPSNPAYKYSKDRATFALLLSHLTHFVHKLSAWSTQKFASPKKNKFSVIHFIHVLIIIIIIIIFKVLLKSCKSHRNMHARVQTEI